MCSFVGVVVVVVILCVCVVVVVVVFLGGWQEQDCWDLMF